MAKSDVSHRPLSLRLLGRESELHRLAEVRREVADRAGRVVLLSGDAGIGKSRLASEVMASARTAGFLVLRGGAHPLHAGLAYAPLVEAFGPYLSGLDLARRHDVLAGLNDLGRLFPDLQLPVPERLGDPALERTRLFEAVARLVAAIARRTPVLLFIDDLHWADPATVEMVHYLARSVAGRRVLLLVTYRSTELGTATPLGDFVVSMRRAEFAVDVALGPLDNTAVMDLIRDLLGAAPPGRLVDGVIKRAAGIPLFVTALVGQLIDSGQLSRVHGSWTLSPRALDLLPIIVRDVVLARLARLSPDERRLLELIAVAGEAATVDLLERTWRGDTRALGESLRRLVADRLVVEYDVADVVHCHVAHPLYAEVAYAEITVLDRRRTHAEVAKALERLRPDDVIALAPHYRYAADLLDPTRTLEILAAAGRRALDLHADVEASGFLESAVQVAGRLGNRSALPELLDALGEAYQRSGELERAAETWRDGIATAKEEGDTRTAQMVRHRLALLEWDRGNTVLAREQLALDETTDPQSGAWAIEQLCIRVMLLSRRGRDAQREAAAQLAALTEDRPDSVMAQIASHMLRAYVAFHDCDIAAARRHAERLLPLAKQSDMAMALGAAERLIALTAAAVGDLDVSRDSAQRLVELTHRIGVPALECSARATAAGVHHLIGDWGRAMAEADAALALVRRSAPNRPLVGVLSLRAILFAYRGQLPEARECLDEAKRACVAGLAGDTMATALASAQAAVFHLSREAAGTISVPDEVPVNTALPPPIHHLLFADWRLAIGDMDGVLAITRQLRAIDGGRAPLPNALADRLEGQVARQRGDIESAARLLRSATDHLDELGVPVESAIARLEWCETVAEVDPQAATAGATRCLAEFERVGAKPFADRTRRLLRTLGIRTPARTAPGVLSEREMEVAKLVAEGMSNAEIAAQLFLSVRTVETHVHNIYGRLDLDSRVALARWVAQHDVSPAAT